MPAGTTIQHKRKAGAFTNGQLAAGEFGVDTTNGVVYFSANGSTVTTTLPDDAVTLEKMASGTAGNLITYDASGNPAAVATGTAGQALLSNGAGAAPTFQAVSGTSVALGRWSGSAVANLTADNVFDDSLYSSYIIVGGFRPATNGSNFLATLRTSVPADVGGGMLAAGPYGRLDVGSQFGDVSNQTNMAPTVSSTSGIVLMEIRLQMTSGERHSFFQSLIYAASNGGRYAANYSGEFIDTTLRQGIKFSFSSGNIASGFFEIIGIKKQ